MGATGEGRRCTSRRRRPAIDIALGLIAVVLLILANGLFVAGEFALVAVDRTKIDRLKEEGSRRARLTDGLLRHLSFHLSGAQFGITVTSLILGFLAQPAIAPILEPALEPLVGETAVGGLALFVALVLATVVQMVVGELVPKGIAIARPEPTALGLAAFLRVYGIVFGPIIRFLDGAANRTVRALGVEPRSELSDVQTLPELQVIVEASVEEGTLGGPASTLLTRSIRFGTKTAEDALVPRTALKALPVEATVVDLVALSVETGHSRFPVYGSDLDDIRGVVHVRQAHTVPRDERATVALGDLMAPVLAVPESRGLDDVMVDLRNARTHMAVVLDEYGGTAGVLTLEDVIEEIVGEIDDEHDAQPDLNLVRRRGEYLVAGTLHLDEVLDLVGLELPEGEYETIAGYLLDRFGRIPAEGESLTVGDWSLEVASLDRRRIAEVRLVPQVDPDGPARRPATGRADVASNGDGRRERPAQGPRGGT